MLAGKVNVDWRRSGSCWCVEAPIDKGEVDGGEDPWSVVKEDLRVLDDPL